VKYELSSETSCTRVFRVSLDAGEYAHARSEAIAHVGAQVQLPGFRRGKVPEAELERRFGREIEEEIFEHGVGEAGRKILDETGLVPLTNPRVGGVQKSSEGMVFNLTIELPPNVKLGEYRGLKLEREPATVRPEDIDSVIDGLRRRMMTYTTVERPVKWGDLVVLDYGGTVEGKPFEGSEAKDVMVFVGAGEAIRDLENALVGHRAGDAFETPVGYPKDHLDQAIAGRDVLMKVTVKEVKQGKAPELDDSFAASASRECSTLEELRKAVAGRVREERAREAGERMRAILVDRLLRFAPREVAPSLVDDEMDYMAVRGAEDLSRQGVKALEQLRMKREEFRELFRPSALRAVREAFVLDAIATAEKVEVADEDLEREVRTGVERRQGEAGAAGRLVASLKADGRWERLRHRLRQDRTLDWVISEAEITERAICP